MFFPRWDEHGLDTLPPGARSSNHPKCWVPLSGGVYVAAVSGRHQGSSPWHRTGGVKPRRIRGKGAHDAVSSQAEAHLHHQPSSWPTLSSRDPQPQGQGSWKRNGEMTKRTKYAKVELRDPDGATMNDISTSWEHTIGCDGDQEMVFELGSGSTLTIKIV